MAIPMYEDVDETINLTVEEPVAGVDVNYNPTSVDAQSGIAVAQALREFAKVEDTTLILGGA